MALSGSIEKGLRKGTFVRKDNGTVVWLYSRLSLNLGRGSMFPKTQDLEPIETATRGGSKTVFATHSSIKLVKLLLWLLASSHFFSLEILVKEVERLLIGSTASHNRKHTLASLVVRCLRN